MTNNKNHGRLQQLDLELDDAFGAALASIRSRSREVVLTARLATAVRMGREAESTTACEHVENNLCEVSSNEATSVEYADVALLVRRGGVL